MFAHRKDFTFMKMMELFIPTTGIGWIMVKIFIIALFTIKMFNMSEKQ